MADENVDSTKVENTKATFTQEDLNKYLADERRKSENKYKKANESLLDELGALKGKAALTQSERDELDGRIEHLQSQLMTKEELSKREKEKLAKEHESRLSEALKQQEHWKHQFTESTISGAITGKSVEYGVMTPQHMVAILRPNTRLVEVLSEDGKPTGQYTPLVKFYDNDEKGNAVTLDLSVDDAIKRMKEMDQHRNLFKGEGSSGLGANTHSSNKSSSILDLLKNDPEKYRRLRKEGKITLS